MGNDKANDGTFGLLLSLLHHTACAVRAGFLCGVRSSLSPAENAVQKQGIPERRIVEPVRSGAVCRENAILL